MFKLKELHVEAPEGLSCKYFMTEREQTEKMDILIVSFFGSYPDGSMGSEHAGYIACMAMHGLVAFNPDCIILDFREMEYRWGNSLLKVFQDISQYKDEGKEQDEPCFPVVAVTSDKCRASFLSLVTPMNSQEPSWHFGNMTNAIKYATKAAVEWLDY
ncbi:MAG: hypothetical protein GY765_29430 [bacterium]|nr:hypothetical protein [bacterium]